MRKCFPRIILLTKHLFLPFFSLKISTLKDTLTEKDAYYHKQYESQRTIADRDIWDLRMKLQRLTESSFDKQQQLEEKYREDMG